MFYYYGAKNRLAAKYPAPLYATVIEPFAGSAGYSQYWRNKLERVVLFDIDENVVWLWHQLQAMDVEEVLALPTPEVGVRYDDRLIDLLIKTTATSNVAMKMDGPIKCPARVIGLWPSVLRRIAERLDRCRHWIVIHGTYEDAGHYWAQHGDEPATWFIDPPYAPEQSARQAKTQNPLGAGYRGGVDYSALGEWCRSRNGQVIVCEQDGAGWLPFTPLCDQQNSVGRFSREVAWLNGSAAASGTLFEIGEQP